MGKYLKYIVARNVTLKVTNEKKIGSYPTICQLGVTLIFMFCRYLL